MKHKQFADYDKASKFRNIVHGQIMHMSWEYPRKECWVVWY